MIRKGAAASQYVIQCKQVDVHVTIRTSEKCRHEVPVNYTGAEMFVDLFSLILQSMATPLDSDMEAWPRWRIYGSLMCGHPRPGGTL